MQDQANKSSEELEKEKEMEKKFARPTPTKQSNNRFDPSRS